MGAFLITGNPGSGKTVMAAELSRRGLVAVDADRFAGWESATGAEVDQPENADETWLLSHRWVWRRALLERFVGTQPAGEHVFVCGIAMNQRALLDIFDGRQSTSMLADQILRLVSSRG